ncbi:MAG: 3-deoxy-D-manno-octulosonic acid transferase [Kiritimatiellae bacterium]|nr:3-deoxy-D-manno-octulosonic acid transferase [Kiritimatiellia bacterium]
MRWTVYNFLFALVYVAMLPRFWWRMRRRGGYRNRFSDRFGRYPAEVAERLGALRGAVWIHAVSVGEVYVAGQVMRSLREIDPGLSFVLSTTSSTGWKEAEKQVGPADVLIYNPVDFTVCVRRALDIIKPRALILTESEIWPNLLRLCRSRGVPMFLVNARVSDRSAPGYRRLRFWFGPVLRMFTAIMAQSESDKRRLLEAGASEETVEVTGSFKFDVAERDARKEAEVAAFLAAHDCGKERLILLGGSTWPGEDAVLVDIYKRLSFSYPDLRLVLVPRHFEKADAVQEEIERAGLRCIRKSRVGSCESASEAEECGLPPVVLADTTGELMGFYGNATIVFVGKSLCEHGSQNMIEPCLCGAATLVGPYTENFRPVMSDLLEAGAVIQVPDAAALGREVEALLADSVRRGELGTCAVAAVMRRKGVVSRCAARLIEKIRPHA